MEEPPSELHQTTFSMLQAAREIGVSKSTMHRYIEDGRVSAKKLDNGGYEIMAGELFRAFPVGWKKKGSDNRVETPQRDDAEPAGTRPEPEFETGALRAEIKMLREMLARVDLDNERLLRAASSTIDDLRERLDASEGERRGLNVQLLTYQRPPEPANPEPPGPVATSRRGLFGLFKRAG